MQLLIVICYINLNVASSLNAFSLYTMYIYKYKLNRYSICHVCYLYIYIFMCDVFTYVICVLVIGIKVSNRTLNLYSPVLVELETSNLNLNIVYIHLLLYFGHHFTLLSIR